MDFVDFSRFQVLPTGSLRFAWTLEHQELPTPAALIRLLRDHRHLRDAMVTAHIAGIPGRQHS